MSTPILDFAGIFPASQSVRITRFDIVDRASLAAVPTVGLVNGSIFDIITGSAGSRSAAEVELQAGQADPGDSSQIQPADDLTRHWLVVGGFLNL
jgi:hypothetical protein